MRPAERLLAALDALREAARRGDFAALAGLAERIGADLALLEQTPPTQRTLAEIRARAAEIPVLLQAAERGLAAARQRLAEMERLRTGPVTYGGDGRRQKLTGPADSLRRV